MEKQESLFKGEIIEEKLRLYFLNNGYYVARGVKYNFKGQEITDIDLFLYGRTSSLTRERINVEIKNKKTPKAFERILWAKGLQVLLEIENCVVATTDKRELFREYGKKHNTIILDGNFLQRLNYQLVDRLSEEDFLNNLNDIKSFNQFKNHNWRTIYEMSKSKLLDELDFSGFNSSLIIAKYFLSKCFDAQKKAIALRCAYITISHTLIIIDYIMKDIAFLESQERKVYLNNGFKYGNLGKEGADTTIDLAVKLSNSSASAYSIKKSLESTDFEILKEYFSKQEISKVLFSLAIDFEKSAFNKKSLSPNQLDNNSKSILAILLDHFKINRKDFFELFEDTSEAIKHSD